MDTAISVCAVYKVKDTSKTDVNYHMTLLASWTGVGNDHAMEWFSQDGRPGTDDDAANGRISSQSTSASNVPSHVCWTTSKWEQQDREAITHIYVDGVPVVTQQLRA